jgi:hypothetical protein
VTSLSDRAMGHAERAVGIVGRVGVEERPRDLQHVALVMLDGTEIRGVLHRAPGTRTLDYLNRQAEAFVAMTDATVSRSELSEHVSFIAINKAHIVRVIEATDAD